jgi:flagellar basal-body rod protein FlgG
MTDASVDEMGRIYQNGNVVTRVGLTDFADYNYLEHYGENYYEPVEGATTKAATAMVNSGYLEMSNVQVVNEMVELISVTRAYESNQKVVQTIDSSLEIAANQLGKL